MELQEKKRSMSHEAGQRNREEEEASVQRWNKEVAEAALVSQLCEVRAPSPRPAALVAAPPRPPAEGAGGGMVAMELEGSEL